MSGNTRNAIEALAEAQSITLQDVGADLNSIEAIAVAEDVELTFRGNDDNALEELAELIAEAEE